MKQIVGTITERVISLLELDVPVDTPVFLGDSNIKHMQSKHPRDYEKYGADITDILKCPDYVGKNPKDDSIEYVKEYQVDGEFVKVAVRISLGGTYFARSLYILNEGRTQRFIDRGKLLPYD